MDAVVSSVGAGLWGAPNNEELRADEIAQLPEYRYYLEQSLEPRGVASIALVDWSALRDACELLEADLGPIRDPFIALANLSVVVGAVIFHDRLVVLDYGDMAARANRLLGIDGLVRSLQLAEEGPGLRLRLVLDEHYSWAWHELGGATEGGAPWMGWLRDAWTELLPRAGFPNHASEAIEAELGYNTSPQRESFKEALFGIERGSWVRGESTDALILDNDIRALIYERFAQSLDTALAQDQTSPSVTYVGGCLRSPMLLARARWADESLKVTTQPEAFLQRVWAQQWSEDRRDVRLPFWMTAVLASSTSLSEVADRVRTLRRTARRVRRRRGELAECLRRGEPSATQQLLQALAADLGGLTADWEAIAGAALEVGAIAVQTVAPAMPKELVKPALAGAKVMGDGWLRALALRLFRPRAYAVYRMAADARELTDVLGTASRLFQFPQAYAAQPVDFMRRLGRVAWIA
ncbi:hypothetical protein [Streptomyces sp. NPDC046197]|uniref:hypothetical protein n=1 Tax=Streptomyces sp. NPDC046197 TaxID=3154337 RepID=UPI0033C626F8